MKMPGYVSLFEAAAAEEDRGGEGRGRRGRRHSSPGADSLEGIIEDLGQYESVSGKGDIILRENLREN